MGFASNDDSDPFYEMMKAPANETPSQATARLKRELDAQNISDQIDEEIRNHRAQLKKEKNIIKVLLLGQAESGTFSSAPLCTIVLNHSSQGNQRR